MPGQTNDLAKLNENNDLDFLFRFNALLHDENEDSPYSNVEINGKFHDSISKNYHTKPRRASDLADLSFCPF